MALILTLDPIHNRWVLKCVFISCCAFFVARCHQINHISYVVYCVRLRTIALNCWNRRHVFRFCIQPHYFLCNRHLCRTSLLNTSSTVGALRVSACTYSLPTVY
eukprot:701096_1